MIVMLVQDSEVVRLIQCAHIGKTKYPSLDAPQRNTRDSATGLPLFTPDMIGIDIECCGVPNVGTITIRIPRDGDSVYTKSDQNRTVQGFHVDEHGNEITGDEARTLAAVRSNARLHTQMSTLIPTLHDNNG